MWTSKNPSSLGVHIYGWVPKDFVGVQKHVMVAHVCVMDDQFTGGLGAHKCVMGSQFVTAHLCAWAPNS